MWGGGGGGGGGGEGKEREGGGEEKKGPTWFNYGKTPLFSEKIFSLHLRSGPAVGILPPPPHPHTSYSPSSNTPSHNVVSLPLLPTPTTREHPPSHSPAYLPPLVTTEEERLERAMSLLVPPSFVSGAAYDMTFCHELLPLRLPLLVLPWRCQSPFSLLHPPPLSPSLPSLQSLLLCSY